jgi:ATP-dependent RNA helicase DDX56/DBP9
MPVDFRDIGVSNVLAAGLSSVGMKHPTAIQQLSFKAVQGGTDVIIGAETGSGKTFAYMLPLIDQILQRPQDTGFLQYPVAIVLAPSKDLCRQICSMCSGVLGAVADAGPRVRVGEFRCGIAW